MLHTNLYFAGKLIRAEGQVAVLDRLGSVANGKKYFPYGEEQGQTTPQEQTKFATYFRDATTALDYADQRYYSRSIGRFLTVDASGPADLHRPQSLNRYSYVVNDPVNLADPDGRWYLCVGSFLGGTTINDASSPCAVGFPFFIGLPNPTYEDLPPPFLQRLALLSDVILGWDFLSNDGTTLTVYLSESVYDHLLGLGFMAGAEATAQTMCEGLPPQYKIGCKVGAGVVILIGVGIGIITEMVDLLIKQQTRTPVVGDPNSTQEFPSKNGRTVRVYGPDGRAVKDIDYCDQAHSGNDPEVHDWDWSSGKPVRGPARPPTEGEVPKEGGG
jgi:RHS repeat-associated protein